jgi:hypothetical protein
MITITHPAEGESIPQNIVVQGTYTNVPNDYTIWAYIRGGGSPYIYPIKARLVNETIWEAPGFVVGESGDAGHTFVISAIIADSHLSSELQKLSTLPTHGGPPPAGLEPNHEITVFRE